MPVSLAELRLWKGGFEELRVRKQSWGFCALLRSKKVLDIQKILHFEFCKNKNIGHQNKWGQNGTLIACTDSKRQEEDITWSKHAEAARSDTLPKLLLKLQWAVDNINNQAIDDEL